VIDTARSPGHRLDIWAWLCWLLPGAAVLLALLPVGDLAYLVRAGQVMDRTHVLLRTDVFTFSMAGQPWLNQQWGSEIVLFALYRPWGWRGLCLVRAALVSLAIGTTYRRTRRESGDPLVSGCLTLGALLVTIALPGTLALRPQLLVVPLFVLSAWLIRMRGSHPDRLLVLPVVGVVWANLHGSFFLLPLLLAIAAVDDIRAHRTTTSRTIVLTAITLATPLITPWGVDTYRYVADLTRSPVVREVIDEWRPLIAQFPAWLLFLGVCVGATVVVLLHAARRPTLEEGLTLLVFTALAIWSGRNLIWWMLSVPPVIGGLLHGWSPSGTISRVGIALVLTVVTLLLALGVGRIVTLRPSERLLAEAPAGVTSALKTVVPEGSRVYDGRWGSWFELAVPGDPVFVDSRAEVFPDAIWDDYFVVSKARPGWQDVLDRWDVDVVVAARDHDAALVEEIGRDPGWRPAYLDEAGAIFVRS
jgi:hypothetical protein